MKRWIATMKVRSVNNNNVWFGKFRSVYAETVQEAESEIRQGFIDEGISPDVREFKIREAPSEHDSL